MRYLEEILGYECGEALNQVAQRSCGHILPRHVQSQVGWGSWFSESCCSPGRGAELKDL